MAALGYFQDDFLSCFVTKKSRRAPLINRGYYIRAIAVDQCVREFLLHTKDSSRRQVLSLGAGFDSLYFRLKADGALRNAMVCEVDFPDVVRRKAELISSAKLLSELVGIPERAKCASGLVRLHGDNYTLLGIDLSDLSLLERGLKEAGVDVFCPTLLLAEVSLTYMDNTRSSALIHWAADHFQSACFVLYEQFHPDDPFGQVMQKHFRQLNSKLHALTQFPDRETQRLRFLNMGWEECFIVDMNEFYHGFINETERRRIEDLEPFDEFEEWHLKCSHYFILTASKGSLTGIPAWCSSAGFTVTDSPEIAGSISAVVCTLASKNTGPRRFGHRSVLVGQDVVISTGGFGEKDGHHERLRDIHILVRQDHQEWLTGCLRVTKEQWDGRLFHSMTWLSDSKHCLVVGGRLSPLCACSDILCLTWEESADKEMCQVGIVASRPEGAPPPRWRHSATEVIFKGECHIFVYGGRSLLKPALEDWHFLHPIDLRWVKIPVEGPVPEARHSHSACSWEGGAVIAGGLGGKGLPLGSVLLLKPTPSGFVWQSIETQHSLTPRYSHTAHMLNGKLLLVGGVWIHFSSVPGVTVINLSTGQISEYQISTTSLEWPLMLHNHSSVLLSDEKSLLVLGGGGNCFSFGTHLNHEPILMDLMELL